jgi:hypothetical protein
VREDSLVDEGVEVSAPRLQRGLLLYIEVLAG